MPDAVPVVVTCKQERPPTLAIAASLSSGTSLVGRIPLSSRTVGDAVLHLHLAERADTLAVALAEGAQRVKIEVGAREVVTIGSRRPIPAFKVRMTFSSLTTTSWVTDTGEIVREESPMGLITVLETQEQATALAVDNRMQPRPITR